MDISRQQFEEWRSRNKSSTVNLFDVWQASRDAMKPVGYVHEKELNFKSGFDNLQCAFLYPSKDDYSDIPLYRLDK